MEDNVPLILAGIVLIVLYLCRYYKKKYSGSGMSTSYDGDYGAVASSGGYTFF